MREAKIGRIAHISKIHTKPMTNVRMAGTASELAVNQFQDGQVLIQLLGNNFAKVVQLAPGAA